MCKKCEVPKCGARGKLPIPKEEEIIIHSKKHIYSNVFLASNDSLADLIPKIV